LIIFVGGEVIWKNEDASAHTVTSGIALTGPDGNFDSGLIKAGETFSHRFEKSGEFRYFCMIHPWAEGSVTVK
jgi:plastocyanin